MPDINFQLQTNYIIPCDWLSAPRSSHLAHQIISIHTVTLTYIMS